MVVCACVRACVHACVRACVCVRCFASTEIVRITLDNSSFCCVCVTSFDH